MAGDLCDYVNGANLRYLESMPDSLSVPWMAVCGNHDMAENIPDSFLFSRTKQPVQVLNLGDLLLVGIYNAKRCITAEQNRQLRLALELGRP